jgi:ubiquinone/menaquinone biosynthesis C-methylase UbiE
MRVMTAHAQQPAPDPGMIFQAMNAYQVSFALKGAIELDLFTAMAEGANTVPALAARCKASEKGVRVLCDFLTVTGFLEKDQATYSLSRNSEVFLNRKSPAYLGSAIHFLTHDFQLDRFRDMAAVVRKGGTITGVGSMEPEHPIWVEFAKNMGPLAAGAAVSAADVLASSGPQKVLDIASGSGFWGIAIAKKNAEAQIYGQDWKNVVELSAQHAREAGVGDRYQMIPGSAFDVDLGSDYDLVLLPNFVHHFDHATNVALLRRLRTVMKPGATLATIEVIPNDDRISPPAQALFSLIMLTNTEGGDAYTFTELNAMFRDAGFGVSTLHTLANSLGSLIVTAY